MVLESTTVLVMVYAWCIGLCMCEDPVWGRARCEVKDGLEEAELAAAWNQLTDRCLGVSLLCRWRCMRVCSQ